MKDYNEYKSQELSWRLLKIVLSDFLSEAASLIAINLPYNTAYSI